MDGTVDTNDSTLAGIATSQNAVHTDISAGACVHEFLLMYLGQLGQSSLPVVHRRELTNPRGGGGNLMKIRGCETRVGEKKWISILVSFASIQGGDLNKCRKTNYHISQSFLKLMCDVFIIYEPCELLSNTLTQSVSHTSRHSLNLYDWRFFFK